MSSHRHTLVRLGLAVGLWLSTGLAASGARAQEATDDPAAAPDAADVSVADTVDVPAPPVVVDPAPMDPAPAASDVPTPAPTPAVPLPTPGPTATQPAPAGPAKLAATLLDNRFAPSALNLAVGSTVTWTNDGINLHTLTSTDGLFDSGALMAGQSYSYTFAKPGTYQLICRQHALSGMAAKVVVQ